ncbi:N-6 DNA methylase [Carnobacteriaceae bacterium 52-44]
MNEREVENLLETDLREKGWNDRVGDPNRNVYRQVPRTQEERDLLKDKNQLFPDYILYSSIEKSTPIAIIEVKSAKYKNLEEAKEQGINYAMKLNVEYLFLFNKNRYIALHVPTEKYLLVNGIEVEHMLSLEQLELFNGHRLDNEDYVVKTKSDLIILFDKVNNKLRESGVTAGIQRFTEFSNLLFLKLISELNKEHHFNLPSHLLWNAYKNYEGVNLLSYINNTVIPGLNAQFESEERTSLFTKLRISNTANLEVIIKMMDSLDFSKIDSDIKGDSFEYFIQKYNQRNNDLGEYFTPRHIVDFLVNILDPKFGEKVYDPFTGTGGMLIKSFDYMLSELQRREIYNDETLASLRKNSLHGSEISDTAKIAKMNMILTGDGHSNIIQQDTFSNPIDNLYDVIISNIPFNLDITKQQAELYPLEINSGNAAAIQHIMKAMKENTGTARAAVIVPEAILETGTYKDLREKMVKEKWLEGIISLPSNVFLPYTEAKTSILLLNGKSTPKLEKIFFYTVDNDGYTLTTRRRKIHGINDLDEFIAVYEEIKQGAIDETTERKDITFVDRKSILNNKNRSLQLFNYEDALKDGHVRLGKIIERIRILNTKGYPTASITNKTFWGLLLGQEFWGQNFASVTSETNSNYSIAEPKWLAFNPSRANIGSFGINMNDTPVAITSAYPVFKIIDSNFLPEYVYLQIMHNPIVKEDINKRSYGTVRQNLNFSDFSSVQIPIKSLEEQEQIVNSILGKMNIIKEKEIELNNILENNFTI